MATDPWAAFEEVGTAPAPTYPGVIPGRPKVASPPTAIQLEDQAMQREQLRLSQEAAAREALKFEQDQRENADKASRAATAGIDARDKLLRVIQKIDQVALDAYDNSGWGETGFTGSILRNVPGTAAKDLASNVATIDANSAFSALAEMRANSPTGAALGNITEKELELLRSTVANLDPDQSQEQFLQNLGGAKKAYLDMLRKVDPDAADAANKAAGLRFKDDGSVVIVPDAGSDDRETIDPFGNAPPPSGPGGGNSFMGSVGDLVEGASALPGLVINPVGQAIYDAAGYGNQTYDLGTILRKSVGLPRNPDGLLRNVNVFGAGALTGGLAARAAEPLAAAGGVARGVLSTLGRTPIRDTVAGVGAGAGAFVGEKVGGPVGGVLGALGGGVGGYGAANATMGLGNRVPGVLAQAAERQGIRMLPADAGGTGTQMATGVIGRTLGEIPIAEGARKSIASAATARSNVANRIGSVTDTAGAGQAAQRGARGWMSDTADKVETLYSKVPVPAEAPMQLGASRQALAELTEGFKSNKELSRLWANNPKLRATLEALTPADTRNAGQVKYAESSDRLRSAETRLAEAQEAARKLANDKLAARETLDGARRNLEALDFENTPVSQLSKARRELASAEERYLKVRDLEPDTAAIKAAENDIPSAKAAQDAAFIESRQPPMGGQLSWQDASRLRSIVGEIIGKPGVASDGAADAALRKFYGALTSDMEATAAATSPRALTLWNRATQFKRGRENRIETVLTSILGRKGEKGEAQAFEQINRWAQAKGGDFRKVAQALRSMDAEEAGTVRATLIGRMGNVPKGAQNADGDVFSPDVFVTQWNGLDPRARSMLFPDAKHRSAINDLLTVFDAMKTSGKYTNYSMTSLGTNAAAQSALTIYNPVLGALSAAGQIVAGKLLSSARVAKLLASTTKLPPSAANRKLSEQLGVIASREPALAAEIAQFQRAVNDNVNQVGRAAASPNEEDSKN